MALREFALSELKLDEQNIRTGPQASQRDALRALISEREPYKLVNLARDLLALGPSPGEPIWVTADPDDPGQFIVLEGNRRVGSFKMMDNPQLAAGTEVATEFANLAKEFAKKPTRKLEAQVFATRAEAQPWIERRHMATTSGVALQPWRSLAKERARAGPGQSVRRSLAALEFLDDGSEEFEHVGNIINEKATTVDRVLNAPAMAEALGIQIDRKGGVEFENGDSEAGRELLRDVISAMAEPDFSFSKVRDASDRDAFVRQFADRSVKAGAPSDPPPAGSGSGGTGGAGPAKAKGARGPRLTDPIRPTLAPRTGSRTFRVDGVRLQKLYRECREIKLTGNENAAALLLRVFLELSSEALLVEKSAPLPVGLSKRGLTDWVEIGVTLRDKINSVLLLIDISAQTKRKLQRVRVLLDPTSHATGSITTLHGYFHNLDMTPDATALREAWDAWENYLGLLHAARI